MEKILKLVSGMSFSVDLNWGISELKNLVLQQELGATSEFFQKQLEASKAITYVTDGVFNSAEKASSIRDEGSIAIIEMVGVMTTYDGWCNMGMNSLDQIMRSLYANDKVSGIILKVHSGGGQSTAGDVLYNTIKDKNKPVVIYTSLMASAALKGTMLADEIIAANSSTMIGSIGTMFSISKSALAEAKENTADVYSDKSPNKNKAWRALFEGDNSLLIQQATRNDELFMQDVAKARNLKGSAETIENTLSGEMFEAITAKKRGLIDGIGSMNYVLKRMKSHFLYN